MAMKTLLVGLIAFFLLVQPLRICQAESIRFGTALKEPPQYSLLFLAAEEQGFWKEQGLKVEWIPFLTGPPLYQAAAAGAIDVGLAGTIPAIASIAAGVPIIIVGDSGLRQDFLVLVRADSPIKDLKDLKGAKMGIGRFGEVSHALTLLVARKAAVEKDMKLVAVGGTPQMVAALRSGAIDATVLTIFSTAPLLVKGEIRQVANVGDFLPKYWSDQVIIARQDFLRKEMDRAKGAITAFFKAANFVMANRQWALEKMKSFSRYSEETARLVYPHLRYGKEGKVNIQALENVRKFVMEFNLVKGKVPPLEQLYAPGFAQ